MEARHSSGPDAPRAPRVRAAAANLLLIGFLAAVGWALWPSSLGGCSTFTLVSGHSMEPTYYTGDLVLARCEDPEVGDVVVYQPMTDTDARVIHRIVGGSASEGWLIQGDNNDFLDPWKPGNDQILGKAVLHVPSLGKAVVFIANPFVWLSLFVIAGGLFLWPRNEEEIPAETGEQESELVASGPSGDAL